MRLLNLSLEFNEMGYQFDAWFPSSVCVDDAKRDKNHDMNVNA
jgi:hypothetical protein